GSGAARAAHCLQDVEELVRGGRLDHACPGERSLDSAVAAGQGACVTGCSTRACAALAGFEHDDRLLAPLSCGNEVAAIPERPGEEPDDRCGRVPQHPLKGAGPPDAAA